MAWCEHCGEDRPIQRQTYDIMCPYCGTSDLTGVFHHDDCRGAVPGTLDVCSFCNEPLFAKAKTLDEFVALEEEEQKMQAAIRKHNQERANQPQGCGCLIMFFVVSSSVGIGMAFLLN